MQDQVLQETPTGLGDHYLVIRQFDGRKFNEPRYCRAANEEFRAACQELVGLESPITLCKPHPLVVLVKGTDGRLAVIGESHPEANIITLFRAAELAAQLELTVLSLVPGADTQASVETCPAPAPNVGAN